MQGRTSLNTSSLNTSQFQTSGSSTSPNPVSVVSTGGSLKDFWIGALIVLALLVLGYFGVRFTGDAAVSI